MSDKHGQFMDLGLVNHSIKDFVYYLELNMCIRDFTIWHFHWERQAIYAEGMLKWE